MIRDLPISCDNRTALWGSPTIMGMMGELPLDPVLNPLLFARSKQSRNTLDLWLERQQETGDFKAMVNSD